MNLMRKNHIRAVPLLGQWNIAGKLTSDVVFELELIVTKRPSLVQLTSTKNLRVKNYFRQHKNFCFFIDHHIKHVIY